MQDYVLARLEGATGPDWLDNQSLEQAVRSTEMLGMRIAFGSKKKPSEMSPDEWDRAGRVGYDVTSRGEPTIRDALRQMQLEFRNDGGKPGCRKIFGPVYEWVSSTKNRKDVGDMTRIFREHIIDTMDVAAGQSVLGEVLAERRLHSVPSLAREAGLDSRSLRNVLAARGLIPAGDTDLAHHVFDADAGREAAAMVGRLVHVSALGNALGCARPMADQLLDECLLHPISDGLSTAAAGRTWKGVDAREIDTFLETLFAQASVVDVMPANMVSIPKVAEKSKLLTSEIVHMILGGFLENVVKLRDASGCSSIFVDPIEIRRQSRAVLVGMSASAAFARLSLPKAAGWALVQRGLEPNLEPVVVRGRTGAHCIYRFHEEQLAKFMSDFTTDARLTQELGVPKGTTTGYLKRAGVRPVLDRSEVGISIYRTSQIPHFEAA